MSCRSFWRLLAYVHLTVLRNVEHAFDLLLVDTASIFDEAVFMFQFHGVATPVSTL